MISLADISSAVSRVLPRYDMRESYLFGSFARGEQTPDSDIDLRLAAFPFIYILVLEFGRKARPTESKESLPRRSWSQGTTNGI